MRNRRALMPKTMQQETNKPQMKAMPRLLSSHVGKIGGKGTMSVVK